MDEQNRNKINDDLSDKAESAENNIVPPYVSFDVKSQEEREKKSRQAVIVIVAVSILCLALVIIVVSGVVKAVSENKVTESTVIPESSVVISQKSEENSTEASSAVTEVPSGDDITKEITTGNQSTITEKTENVTKSTAVTKTETTAETVTVEGLPPLTQTGDNILSDNSDNKYIKIIKDKYNVSPELLVAIYAVPDKGNNFVLEFDGTRDAKGNLVKSPDTLKRVHQVDANGNIKTATGKISGNIGVKYSEGLIVFYMVTNIVMPQYPDYFTGVS